MFASTLAPDRLPLCPFVFLWSNICLPPFRIAPSFSERPWGFRDLHPWYDCIAKIGEPIGEAWLTGCRREWREEVVCDRELTARAVGLIKDDSGPVGRVHLGVLILVDAGDAAVVVRERDKLEGRMAPIRDLGIHYLEMETWSQFVYDALLQGGLDSASGGLPVLLPRSAS